MFNADGSMRKTTKSKLLQSFSRQPVLEVPSAYISLVDMGLIWRLASPTSDDRDAKTPSGADYLWRNYLNKVCSMIYLRHNNATTIILINDNYTVVTRSKMTNTNDEQQHTPISLTFTQRKHKNSPLLPNSNESC